jgi:hypothetical protein
MYLTYVGHRRMEPEQNASEKGEIIILSDNTYGFVLATKCNPIFNVLSLLEKTRGSAVG